jgi:hypothetical protein
MENTKKKFSPNLLLLLLLLQTLKHHQHDKKKTQTVEFRSDRAPSHGYDYDVQSRLEHGLAAAPSGLRRGERCLRGLARRAVYRHG